mmetsp:Transcript_14722/g.35059  ORF Transcript_14722/g.35059 Transcript_14722/m.35059 type:complete len:407 (-) Transcript_14722:33-1253(-)
MLPAATTWKTEKTPVEARVAYLRSDYCCTVRSDAIGTSYEVARLEHLRHDARRLCIRLPLQLLGLGVELAHLHILRVELKGFLQVFLRQLQAVDVLARRLLQMRLSPPEVRLHVRRVDGEYARAVEDGVVERVPVGLRRAEVGVRPGARRDLEAARGDVEVALQSQVVPLDVLLLAPLARDLKVEHRLLVPPHRARVQPSAEELRPPLLRLVAPLQPLVRVHQHRHRPVGRRVELDVELRHRPRRLPPRRRVLRLGRDHPRRLERALQHADRPAGALPHLPRPLDQPPRREAELGAARRVHVGAEAVQHRARLQPDERALHRLAVERAADDEAHAARVLRLGAEDLGERAVVGGHARRPVDRHVRALAHLVAVALGEEQPHHRLLAVEGDVLRLAVRALGRRRSGR